MRRLATPVIVLLSASVLFLGACSKDSSDTTAAPATEAVATDAVETTAAETTAVETTEAAATDAAATDAAATEAATPPAAGDGIAQFMEAIGADPSAETTACFTKEVPNAATALPAALSASYPSQEVFRAMITCTPDAIYGATAASIASKTPEVTQEQSKCLAMSISGLLAEKSPEDYATLAPADGKDWPQSFKDEIVIGSAECNVDAVILTKVINAV